MASSFPLQDAHILATSSASGDVVLSLWAGSDDVERSHLVEHAALSTSAARKLAAALIKAADDAEDAERIARQRANLAERKARLLAQVAALEEREAAL